MQRTGLQIENEDGVVTSNLPSVRVTDDITTLDRPDLILIAVKMWDLDEMARALKSIVGPNTAVLSLQNGVIKDYILRESFGDEAVIGGVAYVATTIGRPGVIRQVGPLQRIRLGEYSGRPSERVNELVKSFAATGVDATAADDIRRVLWEKYTFLVGLSATTCLTRLTIGPIRESEGGRRLFQALASEVVTVGRAEGAALPDGFEDQVLQLADTVHYDMTSSMFHDLEKGNRLEVPWLSGGVVTLARKHGIAVPANSFTVDTLSPLANGRPKE